MKVNVNKDLKSLKGYGLIKLKMALNKDVYYVWVMGMVMDHTLKHDVVTQMSVANYTW